MKPNFQRLAVLAAFSLSLLVNLPCSAATQRIEERGFRLGKIESDHVIFSIAEAGTLVLKARVRQPFASAPVHLLLEGPGGLRVEKEGSAPLSLRYTVRAPKTDATWRATVINVGRLPNVVGKLTVDLQQQDLRPPAASGGTAEGGLEPDLTDGKVSIIDDRHLRAVCRDRNDDISMRIDLEKGTGDLLMRFNHIFSFAARKVAQDRIELRGSGQQPLYLDLANQAIVFASRKDGTFCRVRIYRRGES